MFISDEDRYLRLKERCEKLGFSVKIGNFESGEFYTVVFYTVVQRVKNCHLHNFMVLNLAGFTSRVLAIEACEKFLDKEYPELKHAETLESSQGDQNNSTIQQFLSFADREIETCNKNSKIFRDLGNFKTASDIESKRIGIISCLDAVNFFVKNGRFPEENETF